MNIFSTKQKEEIYVIHNNLSEMHENVKKLVSEGWTENMRGSATESIVESQIPEIKEKYPNVEIQHPVKDSFLHTSPYVYVTKHEREVTN